MLRPAVAGDAAVLGRICYEAFAAIAAEHGYPSDMASAEETIAAAEAFVGHPHVYGVVAELDGRVVGSNFLREYNTIAGIGPLSVDPSVQNGGIGRALMGAVMERAASRAFPGVRLVQAAYHRRSLALYLSLGFQVRESLACVHGPAIGAGVPGCTVRPATVADVDACNERCAQVHGHTRAGEVARAASAGTLRVVERAGRIGGYLTSASMTGHAVAETNDDLRALLGAAEAFDAPGVLVPLRNGELLRWCLERGLRIVQTMTLMSVGLYNEPAGAWLPAVVY